MFLKSNLTGDPKANVFDFGSGNGANGTDPNNLYSIQDEPEVTMLKSEEMSWEDTYWETKIFKVKRIIREEFEKDE